MLSGLRLTESIWLRTFGTPTKILLRAGLQIRSEHYMQLCSEEIHLFRLKNIRKEADER
jgi:hypothetical protein